MVLTGMLTAREGSDAWRTRSPKYASFAASAKPPLHCHLPAGSGSDKWVTHSRVAQPADSVAGLGLPRDVHSSWLPGQVHQQFGIRVCQRPACKPAGTLSCRPLPAAA